VLVRFYSLGRDVNFNDVFNCWERVMNTRLKYKLEKAIQKWVDDNCEAGDWPSTWTYDDEIVHMADAAALVFDASVLGQLFAQENN